MQESQVCKFFARSFGPLIDRLESSRTQAYSRPIYHSSQFSRLLVLQRVALAMLPFINIRTQTEGDSKRTPNSEQHRLHSFMDAELGKILISSQRLRKRNQSY